MKIEDKELQEMKECLKLAEDLDTSIDRITDEVTIHHFIRKAVYTIEGLTNKVKRLEIATSVDVSLGNTVSEMNKDIEWLKGEVERYRTMIEHLDSYIDFSQPLDNGDWGFGDVSGINEVFTEIHKALEGSHETP